MKKNFILILDFGSQYTRLLEKSIKKLKVHVKILNFSTSINEILALKPSGIILSGGPSSVNAPHAKLISKELFDFKIPILGICYGMQLISFLLGGKVIHGQIGEYGNVEILRTKNSSILLEGIPNKFEVWMSHFDQVIPFDGVVPLGFSSNETLAVISNEEKKIYGLQFHPEISHGVYGEKILANFILKICKCQPNLFVNKNFIKESIKNIKNTVGNKKVILGFSAGVDSSVAALLIDKAIGKNLHCIFVDTGLLRWEEVKKVKETYKHFNLNILFIEAKDRFFSALKGVFDPEEKRKIIGSEFVKVFQEEASKIEGVEFLAQGTIYSDVIESNVDKKNASIIKSHHNVGGLPENLKLKLLEPLRDLFKNEVRALGKKLGFSNNLINRHPFPGPGLAVRIIGEINRKKVSILQKADSIFMEELYLNGLYKKTSQAFAVLLPIKTVGTKGDERTYEYTLALRAVQTKDFMSAQFSRFSWDFLQKVSSRISGEVKEIGRVLYDISSKPPSTIEWE